jgi:hypothetical protein
MEFTPSKLNTFLLVKLPSAYISGVRVTQISTEQCTVSVKHKWINQNPFGSMYFATQAMAAELTTGAMVMLHIKNSGKKISMLVANNKGNYSKKAKGRITFTCNQGYLVKEAIDRAVATGEGQTFWMTSVGVDEKGDQVSQLEFEWSVKVK